VNLQVGNSPMYDRAHMPPGKLSRRPSLGGAKIKPEKKERGYTKRGRKGEAKGPKSGQFSVLLAQKRGICCPSH